MKITRLAAKKIGMLQGTTNIDEFESQYKNKVLFEGLDKNQYGIIINSHILDIIINKCEMDFVDIIGIESSLDYPMPFYNFNFEDYTKSPPGAYWCKEPISKLLIHHTNIPLIFHLQIPEVLCIVLSHQYNIPYSLMP